MRILQLMTRAGTTSVPYAQSTLPRLDRHTVTLCTLEPVPLRTPRALHYRAGTGSYLRFAATLWSLLRQRSYDVVDIHSPQLGVAFLIVALVARPRMLSRTITHVHGSYATYTSAGRWLLLMLAACSRRVVCCGHTARRSFPRRFRWCAGRRLTTVRHGADLDLIDRRWPFRPSTVWTEPPPLSLVTVGRLQERKNQATILRALAQAKSPSARLTVIGEGPLLESLQALARDLKLGERVEFLGKIPHDQTLERLWDADGFISMSRAEGLPLAPLEAMGCFCPVVLSNIGAHREIRGRRTDLIPLLPPTDIAGLARAIDAWDSMPADVRRCWGADCRLHIESRFALTRMLGKLDGLLFELSPATTPEWEIFCRCTGKKSWRYRAA
jgi:glycosyltransferase involved in cell wall biosynthesis